MKWGDIEVKQIISEGGGGGYQFWKWSPEGYCRTYNHICIATIIQVEWQLSVTVRHGQLNSDSRRKAEILNQQFCPVFTDEYTTNMPKLEGPPTTDMDEIEITESGITKLLGELNADKAPGPDEIPNLLLKNAAKEISPFLKV